MKPYLAAAIQMNSLPNLEYNLSQAEKLIRLAADRGAKLIALPENFSFAGEKKDKIAQLEIISRESEKFVRDMAGRFQVSILGGGFPVPANPGKAYNVALLVDSAGKEVCCYRKVHLFDVDLPDGSVYRESCTVTAGTELPTIHSSETLGNLGLSVCYDVRFPELYRHLSEQGADVLLIPAAFTAQTGRDHWQVLLQARAIENTCYVVAPAQTGQHYERRKSHGHAMIIDPWGVVLADAGCKPGMAIAQLTPKRIKEVRNFMPSLRHRIFGLESAKGLKIQAYSRR